MRKATLLALLLGARLAATEYVFQDFEKVIRDRLGIVWTTQLDLRIGAFSSGFTATMQNYSSWSPNFVTEPTPGYYVGPALGGPEFSATLLLADNATLAVGTQLRVWISTPSNFAGAAQVALLTDASWLVAANSPTDVNTRYFEFSQSTTALFGTFDFNADAIATQAVGVIPEPSYFGLGLGGACLALAVARRRRDALAARAKGAVS
jgi:hypothetical protein